MNKNNRVVSVNERDFQISVLSTHTFDDDNTEITLPGAIDSRLISGILFTFSGTVDHSTPIPPADMLRSSAVQSFLRYLTINKDHLGIIDISGVILDDHSSGVPTVSVIPPRYPSFHPSADAHVLSIHLAYNWKSLSQLSSGLTIFSPQMLLPLRPALDKLVRKLFSIHVVGRYPWLFGPLRVKLDLEHQWFPSLVRSLLVITGRSENQVFRNKTQTLVKKIQNQVSVYKQVIDDTYGRLSSQSVPRAERSDKDTLILALELILKIAARSPSFKGARLPVASTQSFSNNEALDLSESAPHHPSQDFSGDILFWDDFVPPGPCLSNPWAQLPEENIWSGDSEDEMIIGDEPNLACQVHPAKIDGFIISDISQTSQSNRDSDVDDEDEFTSYVSPLLESEPCTETPNLTSPAPHENFIALDHNLDAPPDPYVLDEDGDAMLLAFD